MRRIRTFFTALRPHIFIAALALAVATIPIARAFGAELDLSSTEYQVIPLYCTKQKDAEAIAEAIVKGSQKSTKAAVDSCTTNRLTFVVTRFVSPHHARAGTTEVWANVYEIENPSAEKYYLVVMYAVPLPDLKHI